MSAVAPISPSTTGEGLMSMTMIGRATAMMNRSNPSRKTPMADSHQIFQCIGVRALSSRMRSSAWPGSAVGVAAACRAMAARG